jgi:colanic acid/amylovoran biosynthesis glycosyltransferase
MNTTPHRHDSDGRTKVLYVLKRFPQLSQTFVIREIVELERCGVTIGVDALGPLSDGPHQGEVDHVQAAVRYLPRKPHLKDPQAAFAHLRVARRHPLVWVHTARAARRSDWRRFVQAGIVADRVHREGFQHIHAHFASAASEVSRDAAALAGCTYSVTAHAKDIFHEQHVAHLSRRLGAAAAVVTVSDFNVRHLHDTLPAISVSHIPNGVALAPASSPKPNGPLLCVARLVEKKGIDTLLRAISMLRMQYPGMSLEIIGTGEESESLKALCEELQLHETVTFLGAQPFDQVEAAYQRCSMVVLPCRIGADGDRDGLPTVIVEALARSIPVISTAIIGIPEVVRHEETGLLVPPDDVPALADAIERLWNNPLLAAALGARGRSLVATAFDPTRSANLLRDVFLMASGL